MIFDDGNPETARDIMIHNYLHMFAISCLYYDHLLTSGREVEFLWKKTKNRSAYWFFLNRYIAFFGNIAVSVLGWIDLSPDVFSSELLISLISLGAVLASIACWALFGQKSQPAEQGGGCHLGFSKETAFRLAGAWEALFLYDTVIFALIVHKSLKDRRDVTSIRVPLITSLTRDGILYYFVMGLANLSNILSFYLLGPFLRGGLSTFASSISVTMMSRIMLNLHKTERDGIYSNTRETTAETSDFEMSAGIVINPPSEDTTSRDIESCLAQSVGQKTHVQRRLLLAENSDPS
ncbi:hypothetical protein BJ165DRAFT_290706 [Panaeolus papilionaceus]|nr:hypothetical protein BJ165DRAFT_290706 [Panaeolus papilionaceus]